MFDRKLTCSKTSFIAVLVIATTMAMTLPPKGWALLAPSSLAQKHANSSPTRETDLQAVQKVLESKILRQRLQEFGLGPEETDRRITQLSDAQLHELAMQTRHLNPGGDAGLGILVSLLIIGILVLLFVYLLKRV